jgi:siderophore synthetase component
MQIATDNDALPTPVLEPRAWHDAGRRLLAKMLAEFMYEAIIRPEPVARAGARTRYALRLGGGVEYRFEAEERLFDSHRVDADSVVRLQDGRAGEAPGPLRFVLELREAVGLDAETTAHFLQELSNTLAADTHIALRRKRTADEIVALDYARIEGEMQGHPWIVFNKGRVGFGYDDYLAYAPEAQREVVLPWIAVDRGRASFHAVPGLDYARLMDDELGPLWLERFRHGLAEQGLDPERFYFTPVHPWQWKNMIVPHFAEEVALRRIVPLDPGPDRYLPQQSIRTFVNLTSPHRRFVKLPMSILNTLVYRGLPGERTVIAPRVTAWVKDILAKDRFLKDECRLILLGEVASLNYDHPHYKDIPGVPYQFMEMLGCVWRESLAPALDTDERAMTMAALLHVDADGKPVVSALIERSGLDVEDWVARLFGAVMPPLLHYLYQYGVVFSPHGENAVLVLRGCLPRRLAMKDFVDDLNFSRHPLPELAGLDPELVKVLRSEPPEGLCQFIQTGLFICHLRYLADLLESAHGYPERRFWGRLRAQILDHQARFPALRERFALFDLLKPSFTKLCLNRNRLFVDGYRTGSDRPHAAEQGTVRNALDVVARDERTPVAAEGAGA